MPKGVIGIRKSKMNRKHNGQARKNNDLQSIAYITTDRVTRTSLKPEWTQVFHKGR